MAATLAYQAAAITSGSSTSRTLSFTVASAAGQERLVALSAIANASPGTVTFTSVAIDGQSATLVGSYARGADGGGNGPVVAFFRANGTANTSINVTCTISTGAVFDCRGAVWTLSNAGSVLASTTDTAAGVNNIGNLDLNANTVIDGAAAAFVLAYACSTRNITWSGLTERADGSTPLYSGDWHSAADLNVGSSSTPLTIVATLPTNFDSQSAAAGVVVSFNPVASGTTLTADAGSYALTGTAAALALRHTATVGSYALSGTAAAFAYKQSVAAGSYSLTGSPAAFATGFTAAAGAYTLIGTDATFQIGGSFTLFCGSGSYSLTGTAATFPGYEPITPPVQPSAGGSGYAGAWSGPKRRKRKRDEIEELIDAVIQAPPQIPPQTPQIPQPPPPALIDMTAKMQAVGLTPPQRKIVKRAIVSDDEDDDEEAIELLLNLLS